ncbi:SH3 domain-containing protein [Citreimonas sp.]|uniref:SH3 domain-containing protein n=1 Tax=Citreimonas sp. TaxID=3036715 RepID=UPI0035C78C4A
MLRFALALLLLASPAFATQDRWPALFDVSGVAADDVLNIRAEPNAGAEKIGDFAPDARSIEVIAPNERQDWGLVNVDGRTGWVSLHYMVRQPGQWLGAPIETVQCAGTEPFWSLTRRGDTVTWSTPEAETSGTVTTPLDTIARRDMSGVIYRLESDTRDHLAMTLERCSDGMSDYAYGIRAILTRDLDGAPEMFGGCCSLDVD